jgi:Protein of unknown function (DUF2281)
MNTTAITINRIKSKLTQIPPEKLPEISDFVDFILQKSNKTMATKNSSSNESPIRKFGCGKGIFTYISDDFDEPLPEFKE